MLFKDGFGMSIPEMDFHIFVRGGGAAACFGRGLVATFRKAKENV